jgi:quercetin dioxygenase-like cupin family protein
MEAGSHGEVQLENEQFRVTKWTIDPGGEIPMHRHDHDYVVVHSSPTSCTSRPPKAWGPSLSS